MYFVYLDEFGHIGPYLGRASRKHNESPAFGLAGMILPEQAVRPFASYFLQQKKFAFSAEIDGAGKMAAKWEKKGTSFIRPNPLKKYPEARRVVHRILKKIGAMNGHLFYYGREKIYGRTDLNPTGLYTTCMAHALRRLDGYCNRRNSTFVVILDQHSARKELLECATKTMFGQKPCRSLASPPFEVESYLNQNIQAADWIATLVGRLAAHELRPDEFPDYEHTKTLFSERVNNLTRESIIEKRPRKENAFDPTHPFAALEALKSK